MLQLVFSVLLVLIVSSGLAQISVVKVASPVQGNMELKTYDSLSNYLQEDFHLYKNQELYLTPKSEKYRRDGYRGFYLDYKLAPEVNNLNVYKGEGMAVSDYDSIQGKYFKVLNFHVAQQSHENRYKREKSVYLELQEKESGDIVYFEYDPNLNTALEGMFPKFPFLVTGYVLKQRELFIGKGIILGGKNWKNKSQLTDFRTGMPVSFERGGKWNCIDVVVDGESFQLSLILENDNKEQITMSLFMLQNPVFKRQWGIYPYSEVSMYISKFGAENWKLIYDNAVKVGFSEEMVKLALGDPKKVNRTSTGDQWVYEQQYLYFEAGKLKAFN